MIRRMLAMIFLPVLLAVVVLSLATHAAPTRTYPVTNAPVSVAPSYPACITEDGAGMALCTWDAQAQGNGYGEDAIGGDCAYEDSTTREMCITLHARDSYTIEGQNGASNTVPNGVDLVAECQEEWQINREWIDSELQECFSASM